MRRRHVLVAVAVTVAWGQAYVATQLALESFSALQTVALRFLLTAAFIPFVTRPAVPLMELLAVGATMFGGQFAFQALGIAAGIPAGFTAVVSQAQVVFTISLGVLFLQERPTARQAAGTAVGLAGTALLCTTMMGSGESYLGLAFIMAAALSWSIGNVLLKRLGSVQMQAVVVYVSLVPAFPSVVLLASSGGLQQLPETVAGASWTSISALAYLVLIGTIATYGAWGKLLSHYPAVAVAPFTMLIPISGAIGSMILLDERFTLMQLAGGCLLLVALLVTYWPHVSRRSGGA